MTDNLDLAQSEAMAAVAVRVIELLGYAAIPFELDHQPTIREVVDLAQGVRVVDDLGQQILPRLSPAMAEVSGVRVSPVSDYSVHLACDADWRMTHGIYEDIAAHAHVEVAR